MDPFSLTNSPELHVPSIMPDTGDTVTGLCPAGETHMLRKELQQV